MGRSPDRPTWRNGEELPARQTPVRNRNRDASASLLVLHASTEADEQEEERTGDEEPIQHGLRLRDGRCRGRVGTGFLAANVVGDEAGQLRLDTAVAHVGRQSERGEIDARFGSHFAAQIAGEHEDTDLRREAVFIEQEAFRVLHGPGPAVFVAGPWLVGLDDLNDGVESHDECGDRDPDGGC